MCYTIFGFGEADEEGRLVQSGLHTRCGGAILSVVGMMIHRLEEGMRRHPMTWKMGEKWFGVVLVDGFEQSWVFELSRR